MCIQDIRIGRAGDSAPIPIVLTGASQQILPADIYRTAIVFCGPDAGTVRLTLEGVAAAGRGIPLGPTDTVRLNITDDGHMVTRAWSGIGAGGAASMLCLVSTYGGE